MTLSKKFWNTKDEGVRARSLTSCCWRSEMVERLVWSQKDSDLLIIKTWPTFWELLVCGWRSVGLVARDSVSLNCDPERVFTTYIVDVVELAKLDNTRQRTWNYFHNFVFVLLWMIHVPEDSYVRSRFTTRTVKSRAQYKWGRDF